MDKAIENVGMKIPPVAAVGKLARHSSGGPKIGERRAYIGEWSQALG